MLEAESAPAEHHILRCVYQYRIGRSHTIADRKGDKAAVDLHRILPILFKHLLDECADIKSRQPGVAGPDGYARHYDCVSAAWESVVWGTGVEVRVERGGCRIL